MALERHDYRVARVSRGGCWVIPWVPLISCALIAAGIPIWAIFSAKLEAATTQALANASVDAATEDTVNLWTSRAKLAAIIVVAVMAGLAVITTLMILIHNARRSRSCHRCCSPPGTGALRFYMVLDNLVGCLLWLLALACVLLVAVYTTWIVAVYAGNAGLGTAIGYAERAQNDLRTGLSSTYDLLTSVEDRINSAISEAPAEAQPYLSGIQNEVVQVLQEQRALLQSGSTTNTCSAACVDLTFLQRLGAVRDPCLCLTSTLLRIKQPLETGVDGHRLALAAVGLLLLYIAASWLVLSCLASFVHATRDLLDLRRIESIQMQQLPQGSFMGQAPAVASMDSLPTSRRNPLYKDLEGAHDAPDVVSDDRVLLQGGPTSSNVAGHSADGQNMHAYGSNRMGVFNLQTQPNHRD